MLWEAPLAKLTAFPNIGGIMQLFDGFMRTGRRFQEKWKLQLLVPWKQWRVETPASFATSRVLLRA